MTRQLAGLLVAIAGLTALAEGQSPARRTPARPAVSAPLAPKPATSEQPSAVAVRPAPAGPANGMVASEQTMVVARYCATCHSERGRSGGLSLAAWTPDVASGARETTEKMIRKLRAGMMPPPGATRPERAALDALATALEARMDALSAAAPDPGWRPFQRLNRAEYAREVRQMLALDVDPTAFLPADTVSSGFDNVADVQTFSPTLMEGYLRAAGRIAALAVGDPDSSASQATFKLPKTASQLERAPGAPIGTRGGLSVEHTFPADGSYVFTVEFFAEPLGLLYGSTAPGEQIEIALDGARLALLDINPKMSEEKTGLAIKTPPLHVTSGTHRVSAAFIQRSEGLVNDLIAPIDHTMADTEIGTAFGITTLPHLRSLNIIGPYGVTGVSASVSRRRIFSCRPIERSEELSCATGIVRRLATRAFRRPVTERELSRLMAFYTRARADRDFEHGIAKTLEAILASPQFVFRIEERPAGVAGTSARLDDYALASRLSFFLWASGPDETLLNLAAQGKLGPPGALAQQVRRMVQDPRADALSTRFAAQWLRLQDLERVIPDPIRYPYSDQTLSLALKRETEQFFDSIVRDDRSVVELLTADYTFANERVARHYGLPNVTGDTFRRVAVPEYRRGILGHGSVLTLTSIAERTSPVMRGKWIMEVLLGTPPPPPPPNVPALEETKGAEGGRLLTVRERMEEHRRNPQCTSCHRVIDPLGLALENFDVTGRWRRRDGTSAVDASGQLFDGTPVKGPIDLRTVLLSRQGVFLSTFTENLMTYALGRRVEASDMPAVRAIVRRAAQKDHAMSAFLVGVVESPAFRMVRLPSEARTAETPGRER
jgi:hypothetical protein